MEIAGLPVREYCRPIGIPILIILVFGFIGLFLAYDAAASVDNYVNVQDTLLWYGYTQFVILLLAGALAGYLISAKSKMHLAGLVAGASSLIVGTIITQLVTFVTVVPRLKDIAAGLVEAGVPGADAITAFGTSQMIITLITNIAFAFLVGAVVGLIGLVIGNAKRK